MGNAVYTDEENKVEEKIVMKINTLVPTDGQKLIGTDFNVTGDPVVAKVKQMCADLVDIVLGVPEGHPYYQEILKQHALGEIINAQMSIVKLLTFKK